MVPDEKSDLQAYIWDHRTISALESDLVYDFKSLDGESRV